MTPRQLPRPAQRQPKGGSPSAAATLPSPSTPPAESATVARRAKSAPMPVAAAALAGPSQNDATPAATPAAREGIAGQTAKRECTGECGARGSLGATPGDPPTGHGGGKDHRDGQHRQDALRLHGGVGHEHQKAHSRDGRANLGGRPAAAPIAIAAMTRPGSAATPAVCISKKLKVPHASAEIARMV